MEGKEMKNMSFYERNKCKWQSPLQFGKLKIIRLRT